MNFKPNHNILRMARIYAGWTQAQMAEALEVRASYVSDLEAGRRPIGLSILRKYAQALQIPLSSLVFFMEESDGDFRPSSGFLQAKALSFLDWLRKKAGADDMDATTDEDNHV